jgi:hypothetical protein
MSRCFINACSPLFPQANTMAITYRIASTSQASSWLLVHADQKNKRLTTPVAGCPRYRTLMVPVALLEIDGEIAVYLNSQVVSPITRIPFLTLSLTEPNHSDGKLAVRLVLDTQLICYSRFSRMKLTVT